MERLKSLIQGSVFERPARAAWRSIKAAQSLVPRRSRSSHLAAALTREDYSAAAMRRLEDFLLSGGTLDLTPREPPVVSVVIALYNRAELTLDCLRSLTGCGVAIEVIAVDNASRDLTSDLFKRIRGVRYIRNETNLHFLKATNLGASLARGQFVLMLNSDTVVEPGAIEAGVAQLRGDPSIGAVGARLILPDGSLQEAGCFVWRDGTCAGYGRGSDPWKGEFLFPRYVDFCSGAFLLTPMSVWQALGGLDESFAPAYYEEVDFCFRVWKSGRSVLYDPAIVVRHFEFGSADNSTSPHALMLDHQQLFCQRHADELSTRSERGSRPEVSVRSRFSASTRRVLVCDERLPHLKTGAGYPRANKLLRALLELGYEVTFVPVLHVDPGENLLTLGEDIPREAEILMHGHGGRVGVERLLRERPEFFSDMIISRPTTMSELEPLLRENPGLFSGMRIIYDAEAIFALRELLERTNEGKSVPDDEVRARVERELQMCRGAAAVLTVSRGEARHFREHGFNPYIVGHAVTPDLSKSSWEARHDIVFVGAIHGDGGPNFDAVMWFLSSVWPRLSGELPDARFVVAGLNLSPRLTTGPLPERVVVTGALDDLGPVYDRARVFVAPTRASAGIPLKVVEAAGRGIPVVATRLLHRQLEWRAPEEIEVSDDPAGFAAACARLYKDRAAWEAQRRAALARVTSEYSPQVFVGQLKAALVSVG